MNKKTTTASVTLGALGYEAPNTEVLDILSEGMLCMSTEESDHEDWVWEDEDDFWS